MTAPLISVILPVFNAENYIGQAVESILQQTLTDFELIVIDDGSTDNSLKVIEKYAEIDPRIKIVSRENRGLVASLNEGIVLARGTWVARMDQDDISLPQRFACQLQRLKDTNVDICGSAIRCFGKHKYKRSYPVTQKAIEALILFESPFAHPTVMMRRTFIVENLYSEHYTNAEDYELWHRACGMGIRMTNVPDVLLLYRTHDHQVSVTRNSSQRSTSQLIRKMQWDHALASLNMIEAKTEEIIKLFDGESEVSLAKISPVLRKLIDKYDGEARNVLLYQAFRIYCQAAASNKDVVKSWRATTKGAVAGFDFNRIGVLLLLRMLRIRPNNKFFNSLKEMYCLYLR